MNNKLDLYRYFYCVVKHGSLSKAAEELYVSQPAISQAVKQLENQLGGTLLYRTSKGVKLTSEGENLYKYIEQALELINTAELKFSETLNLSAGKIRIGASDTLCQYYLISYLEKFHNLYPNIKIQITNRTTSETINLLKKGYVDFGVINLPVNPDKQFNILEGPFTQDCFVCGEKYKFLSNRTISLKELSQYPIMLLEKESNTRKFIDDYFISNGCGITPEIELGSINLLIMFAKIGLGISCVTKDFISEELRNGGLYEIKLQQEIPARKIGIITLSNIPIPAPSKEFIRMLEVHA